MTTEVPVEDFALVIERLKQKAKQRREEFQKRTREAKEQRIKEAEEHFKTTGDKKWFEIEMRNIRQTYWECWI